MITRRLFGLLSGLLLFGSSLSSANPVCAPQGTTSAAATHHSAGHGASHKPASKAPVSGHDSPCDSPANCCQMMASCSLAPLACESRGGAARAAIAERIVSKDILTPSTRAPSVDPPPPKA